MNRLLLLVIILSIMPTANACVCAGGKSTASEGLARASLIFEGRVIATRVTLASEHGWFFPAVEYDFVVRRAWRGISSSEVTLVGGRNDCETLFVDDVMYLVYAGQPAREDRPSSSKCGPTKAISNGIDD